MNQDFLYAVNYVNQMKDSVDVPDHVKEELLPDVDFSQFDREYEGDSESED